jgi:hypothetical protein
MAEAATSIERSSAAAADHESSRTRAERVVDWFAQGFRDIGNGIIGWWDHLRFLLFGVFLLFAVVAFWLWLISFLLSVVRFFLRIIISVLSALAGGGPQYRRKHYRRNELSLSLREVWGRRTEYYRDMARPVAKTWIATRGSVLSFWHWNAARKLAALLSIAVFVVLPGMFVIPRPQYVQITDDNALDHNTNNARIRYLVHTVDLFKGKHREYRNDRAIWLGKINPQGLKAQIVPGRYYRVWVVGIRWYMGPTLFPNIIKATEVDRTGRTLPRPSHLIPSAVSAPAPQPAAR